VEEGALDWVNESSLTPPDDVVRLAKLEFAARQSPRPSPWTMARLMFDSFGQPLTAGVRSGVSDSRQLMSTRRGPWWTWFSITSRNRNDLPGRAGRGQKWSENCAAPGRRYCMDGNRSTFGETSANEFGEFQMEVALQARLRLSVEIVGYKPVRIPPINLSPDVTRSVT